MENIKQDITPQMEGCNRAYNNNLENENVTWIRKSVLVLWCYL
jgi:hypothetical protein